GAAGAEPLRMNPTCNGPVAFSPDCLSMPGSVGPSVSVRARDRVEAGDDKDDRDAGQAADQGDGYCDNGAQRGHEVLPGDRLGLRVRHVLAEEPSSLYAIPPHGVPCDGDEQEIA